MTAEILTTDEQTNYKMGYCVGYLHASYTMHRVWTRLSESDKKSICLPDHFHLPDFARLVVEYADTHPRHERESPFSLIYKAYLENYPCDKGNDQLNLEKRRYFPNSLLT